MTATIQTVLATLAPDTARGIRLGEPRRAGALTLVPVFHEGPTLEYLTYAEAAAAGTVTALVADGTVVHLAALAGKP